MAATYSSWIGVKLIFNCSSLVFIFESLSQKLIVVSISSWLYLLLISEFISQPVPPFSFCFCKASLGLSVLHMISPVYIYAHTKLTDAKFWSMLVFVCPPYFKHCYFALFFRFFISIITVSLSNNSLSNFWRTTKHL